MNNNAETRQTPAHRQALGSHRRVYTDPLLY
jgi:hypothetical protein